MHWTTHLLTGAGCGCLFNKPAHAFLAGLAGHFLLDIIPHHDPAADVSYVADSALGTTVLTLLAASPGLRDSDMRALALWGAIGAGLPDSELVVRLLIHFEDEKYIFPTHNGTLPHSQTTPQVSAILESVLIALSIVLAALKWWAKRVRRVGPDAGFGELS